MLRLGAGFAYVRVSTNLVVNLDLDVNRIGEDFPPPLTPLATGSKKPVPNNTRHSSRETTNDQIVVSSHQKPAKAFWDTSTQAYATGC